MRLKKVINTNFTRCRILGTTHLSIRHNICVYTRFMRYGLSSCLHFVFDERKLIDKYALTLHH